MSKKTDPPTLKQWERLYELMGVISDLAPWEYMYERDIFGVQFPETGSLGFVSVMGNLGEHYAVALYLGQQGFEGFLTMQQMGDTLSPEMVLQVPQLQASLENRELITPQDRKIMKQLNLKYRGPNAWPQFRSYRPGCLPWYLEQEEAQMLIHGLEQLTDVAPRFMKDASLLEPPGAEEEFLVRVHKGGKWVDQHQEVTFPPGPPLRLSMNRDALNQLKGMKMQNAIVEVDVQMMEQGVRDEKFDRPYFPFMLLIAENNSRMILGVDLLSPLPSIEEMWGLVPEKVTQILAEYLLPKEIWTRDPLVALLLSPLEAEVGSKVKLVSRLPAIEQAQREFKRLANF